MGVALATSLGGVSNFLVFYLVKFGASYVLNFLVGVFYLVKFGVFGFCMLLSLARLDFRLVKFGALRLDYFTLCVLVFGLGVLNFLVVESRCADGSSARAARPSSSTLCSRCAA